jgi:hypothetical protein
MKCNITIYEYAQKPVSYRRMLWILNHTGRSYSKWLTDVTQRMITPWPKGELLSGVLRIAAKASASRENTCLSSCQQFPLAVVASSNRIIACHRWGAIINLPHFRCVHTYENESHERRFKLRYLVAFMEVNVEIMWYIAWLIFLK